MRINVYDVKLGQCVMIVTPNGQRVMIDAGDNYDRSWYPSEMFRGQTLARFICSNFDEDHLSDFEDLRKNCPMVGIHKNPTVGSSQLMTMKTLLGMGNGTKAMYDFLRLSETQPGGIYNPTYLGDIEIAEFWNSYGTFYETNDLSLVTFVRRGSFSIMFPGDIERAGIKELLKNPAFVEELKKVTVLVAPHHGRENACCEEMFGIGKCNPMAVIISDDNIQYASQENCDWYSARTSGCKTRMQETRRILTTRRDGHITLDVNPDGSWLITTEVELEKMRKSV